MSRPARRAPLVRLALSLLLIAVVDYPWMTLQNHSHWDRVGWIPFVSPPVRLGDIAQNVALFVPFGVFARQASFRPGSIILGGTAVSALFELLQVFSHGRFPSATDVACNVAGSALGVYIASRVRLTKSGGADG